MPSSISGSKSKAIAYAKALAAICAVLILVFEIASVYLLNHQSATYARISKQYDDALKIRRGTAGEPPSVLMVGNSLLLHGVQLSRLQELTASRMHLYPIFLEATGYYDWLYALHGLFLRGARPQVVVLGVGVNYFLENGVRQDYAPMMFFNARDTLAVAADLKLDRTAASNLLLAHSSPFWDTRSAIRMQVLNRIVPHLEDLFSLVNQKPTVPDGREFAEITIPRLERLRELCEANGARLILLVPPTLDSENAVNEMTAAAQAAGVEVSVPIDPAALSAKFYQPDGMHLNRDGAVLFTSALAKDLPERVTAGEALAAQK
jgi:hypothetical protein